LLDDPGQIAERDEGIVDLGTITWLLRPALPIRDGLIERPAAPPWKGLAADVVAEASQAVCRLDLVYPEAEPIQLGTGFIVGRTPDDLLAILTNAHVVEAAVQFGWLLLDEYSLVCDFARQSPEAGGRPYPLTKNHRLHPHHDLAVVFLDPAEQEAPPPSVVLTASKQPPEPTTGLKIGVIGHPSFDSTRDPFPKYFGFRDAFGIKRFSPGFIRAVGGGRGPDSAVTLVYHDATTLSGSSGSCVLDLSSRRAVGLHSGGLLGPQRRVVTESGDVMARLFRANRAVPLWLLADDPVLEGVAFA
jgi:hypothetical protein